jgi:hypothetical protein
MAQLCREFHEWVEEEIEKPVEEWREERVRKCRKRKCRKWCLCCNKWLCWIETVVVRVVTWVVITVGKWVVRVVCEAVNLVLDIVGVLVGILFLIPILGRLLRQVWDFFVELVWQVVGLIGVLLDLLGLDWEKKLRICIIILRDKAGPLTTAAALAPTLQSAQAAWKSAANVKLIVQDIHTIVSTDIRERNLDVDCDFGAWTDDLFATGSNFELYANLYCFDGAGRRLIGWGAPVIVFAVRDIAGTKRGCSLGPFSDYVTVEAARPDCLAHELGHACYLYWDPHHSDPANLMHSRCGGTMLEGWQKTLIRNSRHITYL